MSEYKQVHEVVQDAILAKLEDEYDTIRQMQVELGEVLLANRLVESKGLLDANYTAYQQVLNVLSTRIHKMREQLGKL